MAKSARASTKKANNSSLRAKVFGPVEDARTSRLADKLMNIANKSASAKEDAEMNGTQGGKLFDALTPRTILT